MEVIKAANFCEYNIGPMVLAMGTFDGLHSGHQAVINKALEVASRLNYPAGVYTFKPHPAKILKPAFAPGYLISPRQKLALINEFNLDYYIEQRFTKEFSQKEAAEFIREYLIEGVKAAHVVVGENFNFGKKGRGDIRVLKSLGKKYGFGATAIRIITRNGERISSSKIRQMICDGKIKELPEYLGRYYSINGKVIKGAGRGKKLGFPTANLKAETQYVLPPSGVYATYVILRGKRYRSITNFGNNPTFSDNFYSIEVHILDFDNLDIYGENLTIELIDFIRPEMTFNSSKELADQINKDILYTDYLLCYN